MLASCRSAECRAGAADGAVCWCAQEDPTQAGANPQAPLGAVERGVRETLANAEATGAPWAALLLAVHYGATFALQLAEQDVVGRLGLLRSSLSAAACGALWLFWWRRRTVWWPGFALAVLTAIVLANSMARIAVDPQPWLGTRLAILFLGGSLITVSRRGLIAVIAAGLAVWCVALGAAPQKVDWAYESIFLVFAAGLAVLAHHLRVRMVREVVTSHQAHVRSDAHLRRAQKLAGLVSFEWDLESDALTWFDEGRRFGRSERGGGSLATFVDEAVHPEDRELARELIDFCSRAESAFQREVRLLGPDGSVRWVEAHGVSTRDAAGRAVVVGVLLDRTEQREAQAREADLLRALARRQGVALLGEVTAVLAQELRQPLAAIESHASGGLQRLEADSSSETGAALRAIRDDAARAADIVRRTADGLPRESARCEPVEIGEVATHVARLVDLEARQRGVKLRVLRELSPAWALVDATQLAQVLSNLLRNGLEAIEEQSAPGELAVTIGAGAPGWLEISVHDSGKGIPPDRLEAIFAPFYSTKPGGTGLGLAVSRRMVESFGGRLWVEPTEAGATLRFSLPCSADPHPRG
jgi:signal transduction histidine kinase